MERKVIIIIVNWNCLSDTLECLNSLSKLSYNHFKIVVVDNGSNDHSAKIITEDFPHVHVICNSENMGYCKGNNIGIRYALEHGADYIWLLNNDTLLEGDSLTRLIEAAESSPEIGLISPVIHYFDDRKKIQFAGSYIDTKSLEINYPRNKRNAEPIYQTGKNVVLWGTALLIKRIVVEKIGLLDERFFAYWEDTEYSLRSLKYGFRNVVCVKAKIFHKRKLTAEGEECQKNGFFYYYIERNAILLRRTGIRCPFEKYRFFLRCLAIGSSHSQNCPKEYIDFALMGIWHGLKGISGPYKCEPKIPVTVKNILLHASKYYPVFFAYLLTFNFKGAFKLFLRWYKE